MAQTAIYANLAIKATEQYRRLRQYETAHDLAATWFCDFATSGRRKGWTRLMSAVKRKRVKRIIIWRLDVLCLNHTDLVRFLRRLCNHQIDLHACRSGFELHSEIGIDVTLLLGAWKNGRPQNDKGRQLRDLLNAQWPVTDLMARLGLSAEKLAKLSGCSRRGRPRVKRCTADRVTELRKRGCSKRQIARILGVSVPTVSRRFAEAARERAR